MASARTVTRYTLEELQALFKEFPRELRGSTLVIYSDVVPLLTALAEQEQENARLKSELMTEKTHGSFFREQHKKSTDVITQCSRIFMSAVEDSLSLARMFLHEQCGHLVEKLGALTERAETAEAKLGALQIKFDKEMDQQAVAYDNLNDKLQAAEGTIATLFDVLKPFAEFYLTPAIEAQADDHPIYSTVTKHGVTELTMGDLRKVRAALRTVPAPSEEMNDASPITEEERLP